MMNPPFHSEEMDTALSSMTDPELINLAHAVEDLNSDDKGQLKLMGSIYIYRFIKTGAAEHLKQAIETEEKLSITLTDLHDRAIGLNRLCRMLMMRYGLTNALEDLELAILKAKAALEITSHDHASYILHSQILVTGLFKRYERTNSVDSLQEAILVAEEAVFNTSSEEPNRVRPLEFLANEISKKYERTGSSVELQQASLLVDKAIAAMPVGQHDREICIIELRQRLQGEIDSKKKEVAKAPSGALPGLANMLHQRGHMLFSRFQETHNMKDLEEAIQTLEQSVEVAEDCGQRAGYLTNLGNVLMRRFERTKKLVHLDEAIHTAQKAVMVTSQDDPWFPGFLNNLCMKLEVRYEQAMDAEDLEKAIKIAEQAIKITPKGDSTHIALQTNLGSMLSRRFGLSNSYEDLEGAILNTEQAMKATSSPSDPNLIGLKNNLSDMLGSRFNLRRNMDDLKQAIQYAEEAVSATPRGHPAFSGYLGVLDNLLISRFTHTGNAAGLEELTFKLRQCVDVTQKEDLNRADRLAQLSKHLANRFQRGGAKGDLDEAIEAGQQAVDTAPKWHSYLADWLQQLGLLFKTRFDQSGKIRDLEKSISNLENAVIVTPESSHALATRLSSLGAMLSARFEQTGALDDLDEAIRQGEQAVAVASEKHQGSGLAVSLSILSRMLKTRFERTENGADLEAAINNAAIAVDITPEGHSVLAYHRINLGSALRNRFNFTGQIEDLDEAINQGEQAVNAIPEGPSHITETQAYAGYHVSLGHWLHLRFEQKGRMNDLQVAIHETRLGLQTTQKEDPNLGAGLMNLSHMLESRFKRQSRIEDLNEAISLAKQTIEATLKNHPELPNYLNSLGSRLALSFEMTRNTQDLEDALLNLKQAIDIAAKGDPKVRTYMNNLSSTLKDRFELLGNVEDIEEAIHYGELALHATPESHPHRVLFQYNLGTYFSLSPEPSHQDRAVELFVIVCESQSGTPHFRANSARRAIQLLKQRKEWNKAYKIAKEAITLLPFVNNRSLNHDDQQHMVSWFSGLAANACSLSLEVGDSPFQALELLEVGRGVILGLLMDDRSDLSELTASYPEKAAKFTKLRDRVNAPMKGTNSSRNSRAMINQRLEAFHDLTNYLQDIRKQPGHERFQLGPTEEKIKECALQGAIILVNVTSIRSDAIIVTASNIDAINLPGLAMAKIKDQLQKNLTTYKSMDEFRIKNVEYREFQSWLWSTCVRPILAKLENGQIPLLDNLPRTWWIGVGVASLLPFHAAGIYTAGSNENTPSRVISSYIPTIKALIHSRNSVKKALKLSNEKDKPKLLVVTMPTTPGEAPLPGVDIESSEIQRAVENRFSVKSLVQPDATEVMNELKECDFVHFACHGESDSMDPSNSSLLLQQSKGLRCEIKLDRLTVRQVSESNLKRARIAYLSACSTAQNRVQPLADETIHLASGFQVAGFGHVIGSMWSSDDMVSIDVAREFYKELKLGDFYTKGNNKAVAAALHTSLMRVIFKKRKLPLLWAQYIHLGP